MWPLNHSYNLIIPAPLWHPDYIHEMTFTAAKNPLCALATMQRNSQMTAELPFILMQCEWHNGVAYQAGRGSIVQRNTEINEWLTPAWKEWSEFKFLQKLKR